MNEQRHDQANKLRRLVARRQARDSHVRGRLTLLSGCKGGVGVSTVSLNLAAALQRMSSRVLLVDLNPIRGGLTATYGIQGEFGIADLASQRCSLRQAIAYGPLGLQVLPGLGNLDGLSPEACGRVLPHLDQATQDFEYVLIDAGSCPGVAEVLWPAAQEVFVVTTPEQVAFTDGYALVKSIVQRGIQLPRLSFLVNRYRDEDRAHDVQQRLMRSCQQFLDLATDPISPIPFDDQWERAVNQGRSIACLHPSCSGAEAVMRVVRQMTSSKTESSDLNLTASQ